MAVLSAINKFILGSWELFNKICEFLQPFGDLFIRYWVGRVFILSGLTKISSWSSTLLLFQYEYMVPFFTPMVAASLSVIIELGVTTLFILGLGGRIPALILFIYNIMAIVSYPFLRTPSGSVGLQDHIYWGILILVILLHGPGKLSLDTFIGWLYERYQGLRS